MSDQTFGFGHLRSKIARSGSAKNQPQVWPKPKFYFGRTCMNARELCAEGIGSGGIGSADHYMSAEK